ncbi:hypothetical protein PVAG01_04841 [Phlyctema vagabunda]|uniref:Secreted protein n=1 Tax=Phlyctema vagabunda TaxID=108571 RepID=A0ABR4PID2_9HELO
MLSFTLHQYLPAILAFFFLSSFVLADLHYTGICVDTKSSSEGNDFDFYNDVATKKACESYKNRNTGNEQWDQCPDCTYLEDPVPHCRSDAWHIGGDELTYYCQQAGASNGKA